MVHAVKNYVLGSAVAAALAVGTLATSARGAAFTAGDIVVSRVGDGLFALATTAAPVFLDEYSPTGTLVQSIALPTTASGSNARYSNAGSSPSEAHVLLSPDKTTLSMIGYDSGVGGLITSTVADTVHRTIALIQNDGNPNTATTITTGTTGLVRSAITDGTGVWITTDTKGVLSTTIGSTAGFTQLNTSNPVVTHVTQIFNGQLYISSAATSDFGISKVGTGEPTTSGQTITELPGFPTSSADPYDYFFGDANNLFVADDRNTGSGGIQHWILTSGTWALQPYLIAPTGFGVRALTGSVDALGNVTMFALGTDNKLYAATDTLSDTTGATKTLSAALATAGTNEAFRGVAFVPIAAPEPASLGLLAAGGLLLLRRRK